MLRLPVCTESICDIFHITGVMNFYSTLPQPGSSTASVRAVQSFPKHFSTTLNNDCQVRARKLEVAPLSQNTTCLVALLCSCLLCWWINWYLSFSTTDFSHIVVEICHKVVGRERKSFSSLIDENILCCQTILLRWWTYLFMSCSI